MWITCAKGTSKKKQKTIYMVQVCIHDKKKKNKQKAKLSSTITSSRYATALFIYFYLNAFHLLIGFVLVDKSDWIKEQLCLPANGCI